MAAKSKPSEGFSLFMEQAKKIPMLSREVEVKLAKILKKPKSQAHFDYAVNRLVQANLRFVASVAHKYTGTGCDIDDLFQEGALGLVDATRKFDVARGYRLISYGVWYIKAYINRFVLAQHSLVKLGTTQAQRTLFFKVRTARAHMESARGEVTPAELAKEMKVTEAELIETEMRMAFRDYSLDVPVGRDNDSSQTHLDLTESPAVAPEDAVVRAITNAEVRKELRFAVEELSEKELKILRDRVMSDEPKTLAAIAKERSVSRERIRQIEAKLLAKLREHMPVQEVAA